MKHKVYMQVGVIMESDNDSRVEETVKEARETLDKTEIDKHGKFTPISLKLVDLNNNNEELFSTGKFY